MMVDFRIIQQGIIGPTHVWDTSIAVMSSWHLNVFRIRLWFRMTLHVSFPISWNGFMVIWFGNDFFMPPGTGQRDSRHTWLAQKHWGPMEMWWFIMRVGTQIKIYTRRIHGTGIFTYIWVMFMIDVGYIYIYMYIPYVDPMGYIYIFLCTYIHTYIHIIDRNVEFESEAILERQAQTLTFGNIISFWIA